MKAILGAGLFALVAGTVRAQFAIDPQTGQAYPIIGGGGGGGVAIVVHPSQTCEEAKWRLEENQRMAADQGRPLPPSFIAASQRRIAHLCGGQ